MFSYVPADFQSSETCSWRATNKIHKKGKNTKNLLSKPVALYVMRSPAHNRKLIRS